MMNTGVEACGGGRGGDRDSRAGARGEDGGAAGGARARTSLRWRRGQEHEANGRIES